MLLGSGELGKEFVISAQRLGQHTIAVDNYENAPAMQVAHIEKHKPDIIVPEIEAIRTDKLFDFENMDIQVVPSAKAVNYTMNRKQIRDLASVELGIKTANYRYATTFEELTKGIEAVGFPAVIKPLMSSSGKGQSVVKKFEDLKPSWEYAISGSRGDLKEVIIEQFIPFESEITLLTVTQKNDKTLYCPPIGHRQERGDYMESWQPASIGSDQLKEAKEMANKITAALGGQGLWGVEFFLTKDEVYFSELSPRPHDTGMVTLAGTQDFNEFELHLRAILGMLIPGIELLRSGASAVILAQNEQNKPPTYIGMENAIGVNGTDLRIFGKPSTRKYRRMGVALAWANSETDMNDIRMKAMETAEKITLK